MSLGLPSSLQICHCHEPLQFQKQLRLQEARRLMLGQNLDATSAAYRGYDDVLQPRVQRLFGSPMRDVELLQEAARETASSI